MKPNWPDFKAFGIDKDIVKQIVEPTTKAFSQIKQMLQGGLTFSDNFNAAIVEVDMTHRIMKTVANPLQAGIPVGIFPISCVSASAASVTATGVAAPSNRNLPTINWSYSSNGVVSITPNMHVTTGEFLDAVLLANQSIANATNVVVTFGGIMAIANNLGQPGTAMTWSSATPSRITVFETGLLHVRAKAAFAVNATGARGCSIFRNGVVSETTRIGAVAVTDNPETEVNRYYRCNGTRSSPEFYELAAFQRSGAALNVSGSGTLTDYGAGRCSLQVFRVRNDTTPSAKVKLLFIGG